MDARNAYPPSQFLRYNSSDKRADCIAESNHSSDDTLIFSSKSSIIKQTSAGMSKGQSVPVSKTNNVRHNDLHQAKNAASSHSSNPTEDD
jgi:hypothetical protein